MNKTSVRRAFGKAARQYDRYADFQYAVGAALAAMISRPADSVLDVGCGTGRLVPLLRRQTGARQVIAADFSSAMLRQIDNRLSATPLCADICRLPLGDGLIPCAYANLVLQWCDMAAAMREIYRVLSDDGSFFLTVPVVGTFDRLQKTWAQTDRFAHCIDFRRADEIEAAATAAGFRVAQSICRDYESEYDTLRDFFAHQKNTGAINLHPQRRKTLSGKRLLENVCCAYERFRNGNRKLPVEHKVLFMALRKTT